MARELRQAAGEHLADTLPKMVGDWEKGRHKPSERYLYLYRAVFPELAAVNGTALPAPPDPGAALERARHLPAASLAALRDAAQATGKEDLIALAGTLASLQRQVDEAREHLERLLREDRDER